MGNIGNVTFEIG
ncbi:hypothetical protein BsWGS_01791 [Bradybaena similaris]